MSIKVMIHVWEKSRHEGTELLAALALADWANDDGVCWPTICRIAQRTRVSERQATNVIHALEASGELYVQRGRGRISSLLADNGTRCRCAHPCFGRILPPNQGRREDVGSENRRTKTRGEIGFTSPQRCNPVHPRGEAGNTSEVKSSVKQQAESKGRVRVPKTDPSLNPQ